MAGLRAVGVDEALRAGGAVRAVGAEGGWAHIGSLYQILPKDLNQGQQGRPGGDNGRGVKAVSGGGRKGGEKT